MAYPIFSIMLSLFLVPCLLIGSEKQIGQVNQEEQKRAEQAQEYREMAEALGAHFESKTNNTPTNSPSLIRALQQKDKKAKL